VDPAEDLLRARIKVELRSRRRAIRKAMPHEARLARSASLCARLIELPEWQRATTVLGFVPMRSEVQIHPAIADARAAGKRVGALRLTADREDVEIREWREDAELEESGMMFLQPPADAPPLDPREIDFVIVPALAADERGHRIGFGKGTYDRLVPRLPRAFRAAVIYDFELIAEVPDRQGDERVDAVATDARLLRIDRRGGGEDA
jgi:5-formyltetrahydrofolate cyclo-ligase